MTLGVAFEIPDDTPPLIPGIAEAEKDSKPLTCQKVGCTEAVVKPARGRPSRFCPEHKGASGPGTANNKSSLSGKTWPKATEIESLLNTYVMGIGTFVMFANAEDGLIITDKAPAVIHELVELAKDDKRLRTYLEWIATPGKYAPLTMACFALIFPILQNHGIVEGMFNSLLSGKGESNE